MAPPSSRHSLSSAGSSSLGHVADRAQDQPGEARARRRRSRRPPTPDRPRPPARARAPRRPPRGAACRRPCRRGAGPRSARPAGPRSGAPPRRAAARDAGQASPCSRITWCADQRVAERQLRRERARDADRDHGARAAAAETPRPLAVRALRSPSPVTTSATSRPAHRPRQIAFSPSSGRTSAEHRPQRTHLLGQRRQHDRVERGTGRRPRRPRSCRHPRQVPGRHAHHVARALAQPAHRRGLEARSAWRSWRSGDPGATPSRPSRSSPRTRSSPGCTTRRSDSRAPSSPWACT